MTALIVDDEANARSLLQLMLKDFCPNIEVVGAVEDVPTAVQAIKNLQPDLVFLDVEMPGHSGFELLQFFSNPDFQIIFTTAYTDYAIKAFEVSSTDYLLKPINASKLSKAVEKAEHMKLLRSSAEQQKSILENALKGTTTKVALPVSEGLVFLDLEEISHCRAEEKYAYVFLKDGKKIFTSKSLKELELVLPNPPFLRTHRSFIVNRNAVVGYLKRDGGLLVMPNGDEVGIGKERREELVTWLSTE